MRQLWGGWVQREPALAKSFGLIDQIFLCIVYSFKATISLFSRCTETKRAMLKITQAEPRCNKGGCWGPPWPPRTPSATEDLLGCLHCPCCPCCLCQMEGGWADPASPRLPRACSRQEHNCRQHPSGRACPEGPAGAWVQPCGFPPGCHCPSLGPAVSPSAVRGLFPPFVGRRETPSKPRRTRK